MVQEWFKNSWQRSLELGYELEGQTERVCTGLLLWSKVLQQRRAKILDESQNRNHKDKVLTWGSLRVKKKSWAARELSLSSSRYTWEILQEANRARCETHDSLSSWDLQRISRRGTETQVRAWVKRCRCRAHAYLELHTSSCRRPSLWSGWVLCPWLH